MKNLFQKIINNPLLALAVWMFLLLTRSIFNNDIYGTVVELGGALLFIASLVNWSRSKKPSESNEGTDLKK